LIEKSYSQPANAINEWQQDRGRSLSENEALKLPPHGIYATVFLAAPFFCWLV